MRIVMAANVLSVKALAGNAQTAAKEDSYAFVKFYGKFVMG